MIAQHPRLLGAISFAFLSRDLWLLAQGGGETPRWLLGPETAAFGFVAGFSLTTLDESGPKRNLPEWVATTILVLALVLHLARVAIYLEEQTPGK